MVKDYTEMKEWQYISGPGWWTGEDAIWVRKAKDGAWWVLRFTDLLDAGGEDFKDTPYECEVKRIDFDELPVADRDSTLKSCGYCFKDGTTPGGYLGRALVHEHNGDIVAEGDAVDHCIIECCVQYGLGAPLHTETGKRWLNVRARARKEAELMMRSASKLEKALDRPVNALGTTAREYGNGDVNSVLHRGPADTTKQIMRKMHSLPTDMPEVKRVIHVRSCPFLILLPEHFRDDGSCKCDDKVHRQRMIEEWEYKEEQFKNIPLRTATS